MVEKEEVAAEQGQEKEQDRDRATGYRETRQEKALSGLDMI